MGVWDHWHPVVLSRELGEKPRKVRLHGRDLVLFRTSSNRIGALDNRCPHRGMALSEGMVEGSRLRCPYHGWSYDCAGHGESPGTPRLRAKTEALDAVERYGAVWIAAPGCGAPFPRLEYPGYRRVALLHERVDVPLELVLDNFTEVEHTPTTHAFLGYALESMPEVETRVTTTDDAVRVYNAGPQKKIPWVLERLVGVYTGDVFVDDWTTRFSPVHAVYDQYWMDGESGEHRPDKLKIAVFFTPLDDTTTDLLVFIHTSAPRWGRWGLNAVLLPPLLRLLVGHEVRLDKRILEKLADRSVELRGLKLSRFDRPMGEHRRRIAALYRDNGASQQ